LLGSPQRVPDDRFELTYAAGVAEVNLNVYTGQWSMLSVTNRVADWRGNQR
jgi:hypothetical protein